LFFCSGDNTCHSSSTENASLTNSSSPRTLW
jgi:hypothetical protein